MSIQVNGTGTQRVIKSVNTTGAAGWQQMVTQFTPGVNQSVTVSIVGTGFTTGSLAFADLNMQPMPAINSGAWYEFQIPYFDDIGRTYNNIASNFAASLTYSTAGLYVLAGADALVLNGKTIYTPQTSIGLQANATTYIYYDSFIDAYVTKTTNTTDATQLLIYTVVTNGSVVTSKTINCPVAPFSGNNIQALSITGGTTGNIAAASITPYNLANSGVTSGFYGDAAMATHIPYFNVNAQGLIISATNVAIAFPVISVNSLTGAVSLGISNMNDATITSPSNGQYLSYNGSKWVNVAAPVAYYQNVYANLSAATQRPGLNFNSYFSVTDDNTNNVTSIGINTNGLTYDRIQLESANTLLGNSGGSSASPGEVPLQSSLGFSAGALGVAFAINKQNTNYPTVLADHNGFTVIACGGSGGGAAQLITLLAANTVPVGAPIRIKDIGGAALSFNITIQVAGGGNIDGASTFVIATNYGKALVASDGTKYYTL